MYLPVIKVFENDLPVQCLSTYNWQEDLDLDYIKNSMKMIKIRKEK